MISDLKSKTKTIFKILMVDYESQFTKNRFQLAEKANGASPKAEADGQHRQKVEERQKGHEESENRSV